jgi:quinol monooxygenase YgiN
MGRIVVVNHGTVLDHEGFLGLVKEAIDVVEAELPGTLGYEFFLDGDNARFVAHETYADSASMLAHLQQLMAIGVPQRLPAVVAFDSAFVLGEVTEEVRQALEPMGFQFLTMSMQARG